MKTLSNNKLIAEFMGLTPNPVDGGKTVGINAFQHENGDWFADKWEMPKYHTSWDWLMPVVEKIELMKGGKYSCQTDWDCREEFKGWMTIWFTLSSREEICSHLDTLRFQAKIESVYNAVISFIKWYNNQNK